MKTYSKCQQRNQDNKINPASGRYGWELIQIARMGSKEAGWLLSAASEIRKGPEVSELEFVDSPLYLLPDREPQERCVATAERNFAFAMRLRTTDAKLGDKPICFAVDKGVQALPQVKSSVYRNAP